MSESMRQSFFVPGMGHAPNPIPDCTRVGNVIFSGGVTGLDPATSTIPESRDEQTIGMFQNVRRVVERAGGTVDDIGTVTVWLTEYLDKRLLNEEWVKLFPDEDSRPVRHVISYDFPSSPIKVQCQFIAVVRDA